MTIGVRPDLLSLENRR